MWDPRSGLSRRQPIHRLSAKPGARAPLARVLPASAQAAAGRVGRFAREFFAALVRDQRDPANARDPGDAVRQPVADARVFLLPARRCAAQVYEFLELDPLPPANPRNFLKHCGRCGRDYTVIERDQQRWLACPRHLRPVMGCGRFNPLRPLDRDGVLDASWKESADVAAMMTEVRRVLGDRIGRLFLELRLRRKPGRVGHAGPQARRVISSGCPPLPHFGGMLQPFARSVDRRRRLRHHNRAQTL